MKAISRTVKISAICGSMLLLLAVSMDTQTSRGAAIVGQRLMDLENAHTRSAASFDSSSSEDLPMMVVLLRLQEIQSRLHGLESQKAQDLSASLFELSINVRTSFDGHLLTPYAQLTESHQQLYLQIYSIVGDLAWILEDDQSTGKYSTVIMAS